MSDRWRDAIILILCLFGIVWPLLYCVSNEYQARLLEDTARSLERVTAEKNVIVRLTAQRAQAIGDTVMVHEMAARGWITLK